MLCVWKQPCHLVLINLSVFWLSEPPVSHVWSGRIPCLWTWLWKLNKAMPLSFDGVQRTQKTQGIIEKHLFLLSMTLASLTVEFLLLTWKGVLKWELGLQGRALSIWRWGRMNYICILSFTRIGTWTLTWHIVFRTPADTRTSNRCMQALFRWGQRDFCHVLCAEIWGTHRNRQ